MTIPALTNRFFSGYRPLLFFFIVACLVYGPLYGAGFVTDFLGWLQCREHTPFYQAYQCFGNRGLYFIPFTILELLTALFWLHPLPWFIVWTSLHTVNAWLVYKVYLLLCSAFKQPANPVSTIVAALIFMLHPWQVEVLAWKACVNYLMSALLMLLSIYYYLHWLSLKKARYIIISVSVYFLFLFTLEFALLFPLIMALLVWCISAGATFKSRFRQILVSIFPFIVMLVLWFLANKLLIGIWIGHYGAETHVQLDILTMSSTVLKYLVKVVAFTRLLSFPVQTEIYAIADTLLIGGATFLMIAVITLVALFRVSGLSGSMRIRIFLFLSAILLILPVTNLYFYYLQYSENDRYTYPAIAYIAMLLVHSLWTWKSWLGRAILFAFLCISLGGTVMHVRLWEKSTAQYWRLIRTFPEVSADKVYLLNVPDNYRGTYMYRDYRGDSAFEKVHRLIGKSDFGGQMYDVLQYNMTSPGNDFTVTHEAESMLKVAFDQWGNWWWRNGIGAENYSTEHYIVRPQGQSYTVEFLDTLTNTAVLYHDTEGWRVVD